MQHARSLRLAHGRLRTRISTALVLLSVLGRSRMISLAQGMCGITSGAPFRVASATEVLVLGAAVNCIDGGVVEAIWAGAVTLDAPISIGAGTVLSITGEDDLAEVRGGSQTRLFDVSPSGGLSLTQLRLSGGSAASGGAVYSSGATVTLDGCVFDGNNATAGDGGAVWAEGGNLTIIAGEFSSNSASGNGGAVQALDAAVVIVAGTVFEDNQAIEGGGALYCGGKANLTTAATPSCSLSEAVFTSNSASSKTAIDIEIFEPPWTSLYGGGALAFHRVVAEIVDSVFELNYAQVSGGGIFGGVDSALTIEGCTLENNWTPGYGGAMAISSATLGGSTVLTANIAGESGGAVFGWDSEGWIGLNDVLCSYNSAQANGGCFNGLGAGVVNTGAVMRGNVAGQGGCIHAHGESDIGVNGGNFSECRATGNGGFLYASDGAVVAITAATVTNNVAERRAGAVYCSGDFAGLGGSKVTIEGGTFTGNQAMEHGGAIVAWGTTSGGLNPTVVTITGGTFVNNTAKFYGGFIFLEEQASLTCEGATITDNYAGDQGGGIYARDAIWVNSSCDLIGNRAPQGAAAYMTYVTSANFANHNIMDTSPAGVSTVYATQTSMVASGVRFLSEIDPHADSSNRAVRLEGAATLTAEGCTFAGWIGDTVVHNANPTARSLVLNGCDFSDSSAGTAVLSPNSDAEIRNAFVGDRIIESAVAVNDSLVLVDRAVGCDDPNACGAGECLGSVLGVLCECLDGGACLHGGGALSVSLHTPPDAVTYLPDSVYFELTVSAGSEGTTPAIWNLTHEVNDLSLQVVPSSGVLPPGQGVTVAVMGTPLQQDVGGNFKSRFVATSVGSGDSDSTSGVELEVESAFYLCQAFEYALPADDGGVTCEQCVTIQGADGVDCDEPGATLASLPLKPGYWRSSRKSLVIHDCLHAEACAGATEVSSSDDYCADGYHGPYCAVCTDGYRTGANNVCHSCTDVRSRWLIFAGCVFVLVVVASLFITMVFLVGGLDAVDSVHQSVSRTLSVTGNFSTSLRQNVRLGEHKRRTSPIFPEAEAGGARGEGEEFTTREDQVRLGVPACAPAGSGHHNAEGSAAFRIAKVWSRCRGLGERMKRWVCRMPLNKVKILVVVWQILTVFPSVSGVDYPPIYSRFLSWIDAVNLDLASLLSTTCILPAVGGYQRLLVTTLTPLALVAVLALTYRMAKHRAGAGSAGMLARKAAWSRHMAVGLLLTFLVFTSASTMAFKMYACDNQAVEGKSYLRADFSISCDTGKHMWYKIYAGIMILVYPVGIPVLYGYILWINRESLNPKAQAEKVSPAELEEIMQKRMENPDLVPSMFLWKDFGGSLYYFEVIDCGRRILLTGALIFVAPGTAAQAAVACMFAFASLLGFELMRPHLDPMDSWLYRLGCVVIFLSNFLALLIKVGATGESHENILGGIMVAVNVLLVAAVCLATGFATQQSVQDHRDGETPLGVAATILTFERRVSSSAPPALKEEEVEVSGPSSPAAGASSPAGGTLNDGEKRDAASANSFAA